MHIVHKSVFMKLQQNKFGRYSITIKGGGGGVRVEVQNVLQMTATC